MRRSMRRIAHALLLFALLIVTLAVMGNPASARMVEDEAVSLQPAGALASAGPGAVLPEPAGLKQSSELVASELTSITWLGQGSEHNCANGGNVHWILTTGGNADIVSGTLYVTFAPIPPSETPETLSFQGEFMGGNRGAMHFYSDYPARVLSAYADYTYTGTQQGIPRLVISHSTCNTTTTTASTTSRSRTARRR